MEPDATSLEGPGPAVPASEELALACDEGSVGVRTPLEALGLLLEISERKVLGGLEELRCPLGCCCRGRSDDARLVEREGAVGDGVGERRNCPETFDGVDGGPRLGDAGPGEPGEEAGGVAIAGAPAGSLVTDHVREACGGGGGESLDGGELAQELLCRAWVDGVELLGEVLDDVEGCGELEGGPGSGEWHGTRNGRREEPLGTIDVWSPR